MDNEHAQKEAFNLMCDVRIGCGMSRQVFSSKILPDHVIKVETYAQHFQNIMEWQVWQAIQGTKFAKWFAPCKWISPSGAVLIMEKTRPAGTFPDKVPDFFTDLKRTNFGMLGDSFVCHDYGTNLMLEKGMTARMRKADWWDEQ